MGEGVAGSPDALSDRLRGAGDEGVEQAGRLEDVDEEWSRRDVGRAAPLQRLRQEQFSGFRFRRQVVLAGFVVDFASYDARLVIEVDGATHSTDRELARDAARSAAIEAQGFSVLRFANDEVFRNLDGVLETIRLKLGELRPRMEG